MGARFAVKGRRRWLALAAWITVIAASWPAESEDVEGLLKKGIGLRRQGRDRDALVEFQRALEIQREPRTIAQVALCEQAVGLWLKAEEHMLEALEQRQDPWIVKNRSTLEGALHIVNGHIGTVDVWGTPDGAEVLLDGQIVGKLPLAKPALFTESQATLQVRAPGYVEITRALQVRLGEVTREHVDLRPLVPSPKSSVPPSVPEPVIRGAEGRPLASSAPSRTPPPSLPVLVESPLQPTRPGAWRRPAKWTAAGLAVVALAAGVVETIVAVGKSNDFNSLQPDNCMDDGQGHIRGGARCEKINHDQSVATWTAGIGYGLSGAFALTSLVLHLTDGGVAPPRRDSALLTCGTTSSMAGATCAMRW